VAAVLDDLSNLLRIDGPLVESSRFRSFEVSKNLNTAELGLLPHQLAERLLVNVLEQSVALRFD